MSKHAALAAALMCAASLDLSVGDAFAQIGIPCPVVPQLGSGNSGVGVRFGEALNFSFTGSATTPNVVLATRSATAMWTAMNNYAPEGNRVSFNELASGGKISIRAETPANPDGTLNCANSPTGTCYGETVFQHGGMQTSNSVITIRISTGVSLAYQINTMLHELFHVQGMDHSEDFRSLSYKTATLLNEVSLCDAEAAGRFAKQKGRGSRQDPCWGRNCLGDKHPSAPPCYYGSLPNGRCFPDPRYKHPPSGCDVCAYGVPPIGLITTAGTVQSSGAVMLASKDLDGAVSRVDWYVLPPGGSWEYVFTNIDDPFSLPYSNVTPGGYQVAALVWDDVDKTAWVGPAALNVGSSGGVSDAMGPGQRLYSGQRVYSQNGAYYFSHQSDGNLVVSTYTGAPVWASMRFGAPGYTEMQTDGNVVSYDNANQPYFATMSFSGGGYLRMNNDGSLVIYSGGGSAVCVVSHLQPNQQCP